MTWPVHQNNTLHSRCKVQAKEKKRSPLFKQLMLSTVCMAALLTANVAEAACRWANNGVATSPAKRTSSVTMSPTTIQFPANQAVGTVIASATYTQPGDQTQNPNISCDAGIRTYSTTPLRGGSGNIFDTGVPGVGLRINRYYRAASQNYFLTNPYVNRYSDGPSGTTAAGWTVVIELVTTATTSAGGTINAGIFVREAIDNLNYHDAGLANSIRILPGGDNGGGGPTDPVVTPPPTTGRCYPELTLSREYTLPTIKAAMLNGIGSTASAISFKVIVACDNPSVVPSYFTFTDAADASNRTSIFKLAPSSTARNVSIQMTLAKDNSPIKFGAESRQKNNPNSVLATKNGNAASVDLKASYIQTAPQPAPGKLRASAYVTYSLP